MTIQECCRAGHSLCRTVPAVLASALLVMTNTPFGKSMSRFRSIASDRAAAQTLDPASGPGTTLTYVAGSSVKVQQIIGDCDWAVEAAKGSCQPTASQTITKYDIAGTDIGYSFEQPEANRFIILFGDTISSNTALVKYNAGDSFASSTTTDPEVGLLLNFFTKSDGSPLFVQPPGIKMGPDDVPNSGIDLGGKIYLVCNTVGTA
jgi:hypothetical protein